MYIARDKNGNLNLFTGNNDPIRNFPLDHNRSSFWVYEDDDNIISLHKDILDESYNYDVFEEMFKDLKWEDDPVEAVMREKFPKHEITCLDCVTTFKYTAKDVKSFTYEDPCSAGYFETSDCVRCPDCGKYVTICHY